MNPPCNCSVSTGIHDGLTFGKGDLDPHGFWEFPCFECARIAEERDNEPTGTYWPWEKQVSAESHKKSSFCTKSEKHSLIPNMNS